MTDQLNIGLLGADGRMGGAILRILDAEPRAQLTAALTSPNSPHIGVDAAEHTGLKPIGIALTSDIRAGPKSQRTLAKCYYPSSRKNKPCYQILTPTVLNVIL